MNVRTTRILALLALLAIPAAVGACAVVLGLDDHEPFPPVADAAPDTLPPDASACGDTQTDPNNCGQCGLACPAGYACITGTCGNHVAAVAAGAHGCALLHGGEVWCWGPSNAGQVGARADNCTVCPKPLKVAGVTGAVELAIGVSSSCVRDAAGVISCWGQNNVGQLGHASGTAGDTTCAYGGPCNPKPAVVSLPPAAQIAVGDGYACARLTDGSLRCWGDNGFGQLGVGAPDGPHPVPVAVAITSDVVDVAAGRAYTSTCATKKDGTLWCWGENVRGTLGHIGGGDISCPVGAPAAPCNATPSPIANFGAFTQVSVSRITCGKSNGDYYCWGFNGYGQLGLGIIDAVDHAVPSLVTTVKAATLSLGYNHTCALDADGAAWCWGYNFWGEVGDGTIRSAVACEGGPQYCVSKAARVARVPKIAGIAAGLEHTVALGTDGTVWEWGANPDGRTAHPPGKSDGGPTDDSCYLVVGDAGVGGPCTAHPAQVLGLP